MRKCEILSKKDRQDTRCDIKIQEPRTRYTCRLGDVEMSGNVLSKREIVLPKYIAENLGAGDNVRVIKDAYHDLGDYAYLCNNGIVFVQKPRDDTKQSYRDYFLRIPGLLNGKIDRIALYFALIQECHRRNLDTSLLAWRNLQKICQDNQNPGR